MISKLGGINTNGNDVGDPPLNFQKMAMKIGTVHLQIGHFPCLCNKWPEGKAAFCNFWWYPLVIEHGNGKSTTYRGFSAINHSKAPFWSGTSHFTAQPFAPQSHGNRSEPPRNIVGGPSLKEIPSTVLGWFRVQSPDVFVSFGAQHNDSSSLTVPNQAAKPFAMIHVALCWKIAIYSGMRNTHQLSSAYTWGPLLCANHGSASTKDKNVRLYGERVKYCTAEEWGVTSWRTEGMCPADWLICKEIGRNLPPGGIFM